MSKLFKLALALAIVPVVAFAPSASALVQSAVEGGDIYRVKNETKNVDFTDPASASACDVLVYKVRIHNPGPTETLTNVTAQAVFGTAATTSNVSTLIVRADNASPSSTTDTATVNISSAQNLTYVSGSTQLLDANGAVMSTLGDSITQGGVSIGNVGVSIMEKRFVQFKMKVNCPAPVTPTKTAPAPTKPAPAPVKATVLPNTGVGEVAGLFAGASAAGTAAHMAFRRFRR